MAPDSCLSDIASGLPDASVALISTDKTFPDTPRSWGLVTCD